MPIIPAAKPIRDARTERENTLCMVFCSFIFELPPFRYGVRGVVRIGCEGARGVDYNIDHGNSQW